MIRAALRRIALLVLGSSAVTAVFSILLGLLFGASLDRSLTLGFYLAGCAMLVLGFFVGNRGPARVTSETPEQASSMPAFFGGGMFLFGSRRWATLSEQNEAINLSAVLVMLGFVLVAIGVLLDSRHSLF